MTNLQNGLVLGDRTRSVSPNIGILKYLVSYNKLQVPKIGLPKGARMAFSEAFFAISPPTYSVCDRFIQWLAVFSFMPT